MARPASRLEEEEPEGVDVMAAQSGIWRRGPQRRGAAPLVRSRAVTRHIESPLTRAWDAARAGRGGLALVAGAADPAVARGLDALVAAAMRDAAEITRADAAAGPVTLSLFALAAPDAGFLDFAQVAGRLRAAASSAPRLVVVESIERAQPALLRLLAFLGRELHDAPVLVVATRGDGALAEDAPQARALADLARAGVWLSLDVAPAPAAAPAALRALPVSMTRSGRHWTLARGDRRVVLRDTRGLQHIDRLLREPGHSFRALDLMERDDADAGPALDARAQGEYRRELASLRDGSDATRRDAAFLERTLARDTGLGGRARRVDSSAERARVAVTRSIHRAIEAVTAQDAELGRWLADCVQTGHACCFQPRE